MPARITILSSWVRGRRACPELDSGIYRPTRRRGSYRDTSIRNNRCPDKSIPFRGRIAAIRPYIVLLDIKDR